MLIGPATLNTKILKNPAYFAYGIEEEKWRYCYEGGELFKNRYLEKYSVRETDADFVQRRNVTPCPMFAQQGINEIRNSIYQRMVDIVRKTESSSYNDAIQGNDGGVDMHGATMNYFMGCTVLPELMVMGRVGVYVDMPEIFDSNLIETHGIRPYVYCYKAEQILNWTHDRVGNYTSVLLQDLDYDYDPITNMPTNYIDCYRYLWLENGQVHYQFYDSKLNAMERSGVLQLSRIPFYRGKISKSLMQAVADHQIALLNVASSDIAFITKANYPFYTEQYDPEVEMQQQMMRGAGGDGTAAEASKASDDEIKTGLTRGRRYVKGLITPEFIHPSAEPLEASMKKQDQIKEEIRSLLHLSLANLAPARSSAESKQEDTGREENGLSYLGQELEAIERFIAETWCAYENIKPKIHIKYPETYNIKPFQQRVETAEKLVSLMNKVPSETFRKISAKEIITTLYESRVPAEQVQEAHNEIDKLKFTLCDPDILAADAEAGFVDNETGSLARGYPPGTAEKAFADKLAKAKLIAEAQATASGANENPAARGVPEASPPGQKASDEKKDTVGDKKPQRGKGR